MNETSAPASRNVCASVSDRITWPEPMMRDASVRMTTFMPGSLNSGV
jgi:hypothetical protein